MNELEKYPEVGKWLNGKSRGTQYSYFSAISAYVEFSGLNPTELIDEAEADEQKSKRERGVPKQRILSFKQWLLKEYQQKTRGPKKRGKGRRDKIGVSENLANMYCSAMKSFYRDNGFKLDVKLGKASKKKVNFKLIIRAPEVSKLLNVASLRDRAIIKAMFESCQGVSEICSLNIGDIKKYKDIWQFHIIRQKTKTEFFSEIGEETVELLQLYFDGRKRNGEELNDSSPLFVKEGKAKSSFDRIRPSNIDWIFQSLAIKSGLVTEEQMKKADINPARPHALRAGGMSILKLEGCPEKWVEFRAGHELGETDSAYWLTRPEESRKLFGEHYNALRVKPVTQFDVEETKKLREMLAEKELTVQALAENGKLKIAELQRLREELEKQRKTILSISRRFEQEIGRVEGEFNERLDQFFAEYEQPSSDVKLPPVSKEEIEKAKEKTSEKVSKFSNKVTRNPPDK